MVSIYIYIGILAGGNFNRSRAIFRNKPKLRARAKGRFKFGVKYLDCLLFSRPESGVRSFGRAWPVIHCIFFMTPNLGLISTQKASFCNKYHPGTFSQNKKFCQYLIKRRFLWCFLRWLCIYLPLCFRQLKSCPICLQSWLKASVNCMEVIKIALSFFRTNGFKSQYFRDIGHVIANHHDSLLLSVLLRLSNCGADGEKHWPSATSPYSSF